MAMIRVIFSLLLVLVFTQKAYGADTTQLVYIYCDYLLSKSPTVEDESTSWKNLVRRFERREPITQQLEIDASPYFKACVEANRSLFDTGEFISEGLQRTRETLLQLESKKIERPNLLIVSVSEEERAVNTADFQVRLEEETVDFYAQKRIEADTLAREKVYLEQWNLFLATVQENWKNPIPLISLK